MLCVLIEIEKQNIPIIVDVVSVCLLLSLVFCLSLPRLCLPPSLSAKYFTSVDVTQAASSKMDVSDVC